MDKERIASLKYILGPSSIAVIGASTELTKPGGIVLANLLEGGFKGKVYPVNPSQQEIYGLRCYPSVLEIPETVEMAIIAVTAPHVIKLLKECIAKGVKGVIIFTSGFAEVGGEGVDLQEEIRKLTSAHNIRVCGPNCMGSANFHKNMKAYFTFGPLPENPSDVPKVLSFITQSGGFGVSVYSAAVKQGFAFSYYLSTGNEADIDFAEALAYLVNDPHTEIIAGYMEGVRDGRKLALAADMAIEARKPVVILKTGRFQASARAALSHTGALTGSTRVYSSFFRQKAIIPVTGIEELMAVFALLNGRQLPQGKRAAIFAFSGGHAVVMADKCVEAGLEVASLSEQTRTRLAGLLPSFAATGNPIDFTGLDLFQKGLIEKCVSIALEDPGVDLIIISHLAGTASLETPVVEQLIRLSTFAQKPVIVVVTGAGEYTYKHLEYLCKHRVPAVLELDFAMRAINSVADYVKKVNTFQPGAKTRRVPSGAKQEVSRILSSLKPGEKLSETEAKKVLAAYGIRVTREEQASTAEEAVDKAEQLGYPVVVKVDSPDILHKTEAGGIRLNLNSAEEVRKAFDEVLASARRYSPESRLRGVLVQEMLKDGTEVIVGIGSDPAFGSTVMFGLGGIFVEVLEDVSLRVVPFGEPDAREMIREIKGYRLLEGVRGKPPADTEAIVEVILKVAQLAEDFPQIAELDINPLIVFEKGACAADALLVLGS